MRSNYLKKKMSKPKNKKVGKGQPQSTKTQPSSFRWMYVLLFTLAVLLYANTINHEFAFDDSVVITGNKYTMQGFEGIKTLATKDLFFGIYGNSLDLEGGRWRPLTLVMFAVEYQFFGDNPLPYHLINILLYGLTAIILFMTLMELFQSIGGKGGGVLLSFISTLLFIAHPIHTEVVANIKSRDEIMSFLFLCLTLFYLFKYVKTDAKKYIIYGVVCLFTALLSKENGVTFIAIIPLSLFCFANKTIKQSLLLTAPFFITAFIYFAIRTSLVGIIGDRESNDLTDNPFLQINFPELPTLIPFAQKIATVFWILLKYLLLLIFPHPLTSDYGFSQIPVIGFSDPKAIASILVYVGLIVFALNILWKEFQNRKLQTIKASVSYEVVLAFCILFFLGTISIVSNLLFLIGTTMGERFAFISSLGFCIALAVLFQKIFNWDKSVISSPNAAIKLYPLLIILAPYFYKTIDRNPDWKNNEALFTADVKTSTNSANAHYYYANTLFTSHMEDEPSPKRDSIFAEAKREFQTAMRINPYFHYCYYNIGLIWEKLGQPDSAIVYQLKTINLKPDNTMAQYMAKGALGLVYGKLKGDFEKAIPLLKEALANKPEDTGYHENLGICYAMKGDFDNSIKEFETSLKFKTKLTKQDARIYMNLGLSYQNKGEKQKGDDYFQKAFQLDPSLRK